jgi:Fic family protein
VKPPFLPPKLPPHLDYTPLLREIGDAHDEIGRLRGVVTNLPNPDLLTTPLITKEAVLSSKIEGTQATIQDVFQFEATEQQDDGIGGIREVLNYRMSLRQGFKLLHTDPIAENLIKRLHHTLMTGVRGHQRMPGEFRQAQVHIGPLNDPDHARYVPPLPDQIPEVFSNLMQYVNSTSEADALVQIGVAHYQFEAIHPFMDGNGRIGRLLIPLMLYKQGRLSYPLLYVSEFFEEHRDDYYDTLNGVSEKDDWTAWLLFFLKALGTQARRTTDTALAILGLYEKVKREVATINSRYSIQLLDIIFRNPVVSAPQVIKELDAKSDQTAYGLLQKFVSKGILVVDSERSRYRTYSFMRLIDLLH